MTAVDFSHIEMGVFRLVRSEDVSGYSGTGTVAFGTLYPVSKKVTLNWVVPGKPHTVGVYDSLEECLDIHGHGTATHLEWDWFKERVQD